MPAVSKAAVTTCACGCWTGRVGFLVPNLVSSMSHFQASASFFVSCFRRVRLPRYEGIHVFCLSLRSGHEVYTDRRLHL